MTSKAEVYSAWADFGFDIWTANGVCPRVSGASSPEKCLKLKSLEMKFPAYCGQVSVL